MKKLLLIGILLISVAIVAGEVSHPASQISFGDFPSGNYSFDGNVGIGTTSPASALSNTNSGSFPNRTDTDDDWNANALTWNGGGSSEHAMMVRNGGSTPWGLGIVLGVDNPDSGDRYISFIDNTGDAQGYIAGIGSGTDDGIAIDGDGGAIILNEDGGNVGIGTSNPGYKLSIVESVSGEANALIYSVVANQNARLILKTAAGTGNPYIKFDSNNTDFSIGVDQDDSDKFKFSATNGFGTSLMTIQRDGNVGIGTTNPGSYRLYVSGGEAYCDQTTCWNDASDIIFKKDIIDLNYGLDEIMQIEPRRFVYKKNNQMGIGMIAQELETIIPEVVSGKNGSMGIAYGSLTPVIINAIQEQQSEIQKLKKQNDELKQIVCLDHPRAEVCK